MPNLCWAHVQRREESGRSTLFKETNVFDSIQQAKTGEGRQGLISRVAIHPRNKQAGWTDLTGLQKKTKC